MDKLEMNYDLVEKDREKQKLLSIIIFALIHSNTTEQTVCRVRTVRIGTYLCQIHQLQIRYNVEKESAYFINFSLHRFKKIFFPVCSVMKTLARRRLLFKLQPLRIIYRPETRVSSASSLKPRVYPYLLPRSTNAHKYNLYDVMNKVR